MEIDDNNGQEIDDEATVIVTETLKELQKSQIETQDKDNVMVEKQTDV